MQARRRNMISRAERTRVEHACGPARRFITLGIDVSGLNCLVVGGGRIGARKALTLADHGAVVRVCSPRIHQRLRLALREERLSWEPRCYSPAMLRGVRFVVAATNDRAINLRISEDAERRGIAFCLVSDHARSQVIFPATCETGDLVVAVHTHGRSPKRSAEIRDRIGGLLGPEVLQQPDPSVGVSRGEPRHGRSGMVYIVGAGPGAPDLIAVRGLRAVQSADLVIFDRILGRDFAEQLGLDPSRSEIEWLGAGRMASRRQADINQRMLRACLMGRVVARVKNGDPFVFGRGGEEIDFLIAHGIEFEIIPGISSALGALTAAGYVATAREKGRSFAVTSAQLAGGVFNKHYPKADSLIVLMAVGVLDQVVDCLVSDGWSQETPTVVIERGTQAGEREVAGRLRDIAGLARAHDIESPAVLAVGAAAACKYVSARPDSARHISVDPFDPGPHRPAPSGLEQPLARVRGAAR
jgi:uroporphyrin-III C-methyltransferase / precorrin-2 dehydrogenase / sirohydrochlorin ferrochelatase